VYLRHVLRARPTDQFLSADKSRPTKIGRVTFRLNNTQALIADLTPPCFKRDKSRQFFGYEKLSGVVRLTLHLTIQS